MNRREVIKALAATTCTLESGRKHWHIRGPDGELLGIISLGTLRSGTRGHGEKNLRQLLKRLRATYPNG